jgi:uncharacterized protein (DUF4213/DUF364 family)
LNAISQHIFELAKANDWGNPYIEIKINLIDYLKVDNNTRIIFIGFIKPLIQKVANLTENLLINEDNPLIKGEFDEFPVKANIEQLSLEERATDILICSGTTIINDSIELILEAFRKKVKYILLIGPSSSMIPDILFESGIDLVGGMKIINSKSTLKVLQEGGGTKIFKKYGIKYNIIKQ